MRKTLKNSALGAAAAALMFSSTAGIAAPAVPAAAAPQVQNSWMALSMMSPVGVSALGGAAAVAQPGPPPETYDRLPPPPIPVLVVVLATLLTMIYIATKHEHHEVPAPNSPA